MKSKASILTRWLALLLALSLCLPLLASCNPEESSESASESESESESQSVTAPGQKADYTLTVKSVGGLPLADIAVRIYADQTLEDLVEVGTTDKNGKVKFEGLKVSSTYHAKLTAPTGYQALEKYLLTGNDTAVTLPSAVTAGEHPDGMGSVYKVGDVMRDFTMKDIDGTTYTLSELLARETGKGKNGVILNFWYTTCSYCLQEFPGMNAAYKALAEEHGVEILAINDYAADNADKVDAFKENWTKPSAEGGYGYDEALVFPMIKDNTYGLFYSFGTAGYPTTVMIDRYGVITMIHAGAIAESKFEAMFTTLGNPGYTQKLYSTIDDLVPPMKPGELGLTMPDSDTLTDAFVTKETGKAPAVSFYPEKDPQAAEYSFPFKTVTKNGVSAICSTNINRDASFAMLYADVTLKAGDVLAFDYLISSEEINDEFLLFVDNKNIYTVSGEANSFETCVAFVQECVKTHAAGEDCDCSETHTLAFCYLKSESLDGGDDCVYLSNLRTMSLAELNGHSSPVYIHRFAADGFNETTAGYNRYVSVILHTDGFYYVDKNENGSVDASDPLLLCDLIGATHFSTAGIYELAYNGALVKDGHNYYEDLIAYISYAGNSAIPGVCSVNEELKALLVTVTEILGTDIGNPDEWLQICLYYDAYATDARFEDPIKGLATHTAYTAVLGVNEVSYNRPIIPRGLLFRFTPTESGVYRIKSNAVIQGSKVQCEGWLFSEDGWKNTENPYALLTYDYCERMNDDTYNVSMVYYMEAGVDYYINIAFWDPYQYGTIPFTVSYLGEDYDYLRTAAEGVFTTEDESLDVDHLILNGVKALLHTDGYYYADRNKNGVVDAGESRIYVDFKLPCQLFEGTLLKIVYADMFKFDKSDFDKEILSVLETFEGTDEQKKAACRSFYENKYNEDIAGGFITERQRDKRLAEIDEIFAGIYHGLAKDDAEPDKTAIMKTYLESAYGYKKTGNEITFDLTLAESQLAADEKKEPCAKAQELLGCVAVNAELAEILQMLVDTYVFEDVEDSWRALCYYYEHNPGQSVAAN